jgi:PAS domain S-box-containing protein
MSLTAPSPARVPSPDGPPLGTALLDADGVVLRADPALAALLGRDPASLAGMPLASLVNEGDRRQEQAALDRVLSGRQQRDARQVRLLRRDGRSQKVWMEHQLLLGKDAERYVLLRFEAVEDRRTVRYRERVRSQAPAAVDVPGAARRVAASLAARVQGVATVALVSDDGHWLIPTAHHHPDARVRDTFDQWWLPTAAPTATGLFADGLRTDTATLVTDLTEPTSLLPASLAVAQQAMGLQQMIRIPLRAGQHLVGLLGAHRFRGDDPFTPEDLAALTEVAVTAGLELHVAQLQARADAAQEASVDDLPQQLLNVLPGHAAVVSPQGQALLVDAGWREWASAIRGASGPLVGAGTTLRDVLASTEAGSWEQAVAVGVAGVLSGALPEYQLEQTRTGPDGHPVWEQVRAVPLPMPGRGALLTVTDITARRRLEEQLRHQRSHDAPTGLPNQELLTRRLGWSLSRVRREGGRCSVLVLTLDQTREISATTGTAGVDAALRTIAARIEECGELVGVSLGRLTTSQLALVQEHPVRQDRSVLDTVELELAEEVVAAARGDVLLPNGRTVDVSVSVGVASGAGTADVLLRNASSAAQTALARGGDRAEFADPAVLHRAGERLTVRREAAEALRQGLLRPHYQPQVELATGAVVGVEALVRWDHPQRGLLVAAQFLPDLVDAPLMVDLGDAVLRTACEDLAPMPAGIGISVNVCPRSLMDPGFARRVRATHAATGLSPRRLTLELTESTLLADLGAAHAILDELRAEGVQVSIDDFGTGFSSLAYLRQLPADELKLDLQFVQAAVTGPQDRHLLATMVTLADGLGLRTVAEGVETAEQRALLEELGVQAAQGFLFCGAVPSSELPEVLLP